MHARRILALATILLLPIAGDSGCGVHPRGGPLSTERVTVEPTLPLSIDMRFEAVEHASGEERGRLIIDVMASRAIRGLEMALSLPDDATVVDGSALPSQPLDLAAGESRTYSFPVRGPGRRDLPARLTGSFRTEDGRLLRLGQGVTLAAQPPAQGRSHLGAWEVGAVPLEALHP